MHRNVYGAYVHFNNALNLMLGDIRMGDIISEKEGKTGIVVLKIKAIAKTLRQLVDKAENALITAGMFIIHQIGFKLET